MVGGVLGISLIGMGKDLWSVLAAWPLDGKTTAAQARNMERACGLAVAASWTTGLGTLAFQILTSDLGKLALKTISSAIGVYIIAYMFVMIAFFSAHRMRSRRWLAERKQE